METKSFTIDVKSVDDDEFGPHGGFTAIISDPTVDRDGEKIMPGAFDPLPARIPIDVNHSRDVLDTIGHATLSTVGDKVIARAKFASTDKAQTVRRLMQEGHINGVSVQFTHAERGRPDEKGIVPINKAELVKFGVVDIPSNPSAMALSVKSADDDVDDLTDPDHPTVQLAKALGIEATEVSDKLDDDAISALTNVLDTLGTNAARQAYRATGRRTGKAKAPEASDTVKADHEADRAADNAAKTYTLNEAREELKAELEAERRAKMLDVITDPDVVAAQLGPANLKRQLYASLVTEMAEHIVLARVPDGVDYKSAATAAQTAVDALTTITDTPATPPPGQSPTTQVADIDAQALERARAEVIAQQEQATQALASLLQGITR